MNVKKNYIVEGTSRPGGSIRVALKDYLGETRYHEVHRLVASHFLSTYRKEKNVLHRDEDNSNNRAENLKFGNGSRIGQLMPPREQPKRRYVKIVETGMLFDNARVAAEYLGVDVSSVYRHLRRERDKINGVTLVYSWD